MAAWNAVGTIGHAVMNPSETYHGLKNADWGGIGSQLKHDYLTEEGWKQGIGEHPLSRALDVGMLAAGPEALAARSGIGGLETAAKVARAVDPAALLTKGVGKAVDLGEKGFFNLAGGTGTGTGGKSLNLLRESGREGGDMAKAAWAGLQKQGDPAAAVEGFRNAARAEKAARQHDYLSGMVDVGKDKQQLDMLPVTDALDNVEKRFGRGSWVSPFKPSQVSKDTQATRDALNQAVYQHQSLWAMTSDPKLYNPVGFDDLKHEIDAIRDTTTPGTESYAAATSVRQAIAKEIKDNSPIYETTMADYAKQSNALRAYDKELSLGGTSDAALRKLHSALRDNVTANFGRRWALAHELASKNPEAREALYNIAGQANSSWTPRGLVGSFKTQTLPFVGPAAYLGGYFQPWMWPALAAQSPKLMGHLALASGKLARNAAKVPWRPAIYAGHAASSPYAQQALSPYPMQQPLP
jgi:hypothetical protein